MKSVMKKLASDEKGAAFVVALVLLLIGGLLSAALLGHMGAGLLAGEVYETRTAELYAADAGVEHAIWKIQHGEVEACAGQPIEPPYNINVNGRNVTVYIELDIDTGMYKITSIAITIDDGNTAAIESSTAVESYVYALYMDFSSLLDNAIVSQDTIDIQPGTEINGDMWLPDEDDLEDPPHWIHNGAVKDEDDIPITWPTYEQLSGYYWDDVKHLEEEAYPDGYIINIPPGTTEADPYIIGPLVAAGDLTIQGTGWMMLDGTIYVNGNLVFKATPQINIDLNQQTIFVEGSIYIPPDVNLSGSGCIIAVGDIDFQPSIASAEDDFVLVMSITGTVWFKPSGDFTGCVAGNTEVQLQPGGTINWISPEGKGLDFPGMDGGDELPPVAELSIESWEVSQQ